MCGAAAYPIGEAGPWLSSLIAAKGCFCHSPVPNMPGLSAEEDLGALLEFPQDNSSWSTAAEPLAWEWLLGASLGCSWRARGCSCQEPALSGRWKCCTEPLARMSLGTVLSLR